MVDLGGHVWLLWRACMVAPRGHVWLLGGYVVSPRGACMVAPGGGHAWDTTRYADTVDERAVRILLECILVLYKFNSPSGPVCFLIHAMLAKESA